MRQFTGNMIARTGLNVFAFGKEIRLILQVII